MMHELIDREDPKCLYCNGKCDFTMDGDFLAGTLSLTYEVQILKCRRCFETFEIHWIDDAGEVRYSSFVFTCGSLTVYNQYEKGFCIGGKELLHPASKSLPYETMKFVPEFLVDFSDKNKLWEKLKTYLVFS